MERLYVQILQEEYLKRLKLNPLYSKRAFAKFLAISPGSLTEILAGKRKLTYKNALKIAAKLGLSELETKNFVLTLDDTKETFEKRQKERAPKEKRLSDDYFEIVSNWYCFAILNMADCYDFKWSFTWIAKRLGISPVEVKDAVERMCRVGLIEKIETKKGVSYQAVSDFVMSPDGISSKAVRHYHHQILDKAHRALEEQSVEEREISGISLAINPNNLDQIKKDVDDFQRQLIEKYSKGKRDEVYHLEFALFKLTQG